MRKYRIYKIRNTPEDIKSFFAVFQPDFLKMNTIPIINYYDSLRIDFVGIEYMNDSDYDNKDVWNMTGFSSFRWYMAHPKKYEVIIWSPCDLNMKEIDI